MLTTTLVIVSAAALPACGGGARPDLGQDQRHARPAYRVDGQPEWKARGAALAGSAYVVVDLRTHATMGEQRGEWLDAPVWPGSIAKLATYTAAIEAGAINGNTRIVCTRHVVLRDGRRIDCSHPAVATGLSLTEAVALSCNVFAAEVARRLSASQLAAGFARLGLPVPSASGGGESDRVAVALGLGGVQVVPRRLLSALERVMRIDRADAAADAWAALRDGLRESARRGTASALGSAGIDAFAKTGTAMMPNGRPLGLVVVLAPAPTPRFGVIVALPGGAGADAAGVAATLLSERLGEPQLGQHQLAQSQPAQSQTGQNQLSQKQTAAIRVGTPTASGGYRVDEVPLEDYVARVVAGETSAATPPAAREALAITARTYALANRGRHAADGFDLCTLTHCQVLRPASETSREAASRTRGQILTRVASATSSAPPAPPVPVPVFYSASCGGLLEDASTLLPDTPPGSIAWMTSRADPAGVEEPTWHAELTASDLLRALRDAGLRGDSLRDLRVDTSATGRVTRVTLPGLTLPGLTPATLSADDFRRIIGQQLGWQRLKSLRFTVDRTARGYRFDGRGHGHAVGLCVFGASALATQGKSRDAILQAYFPGLRIASLTTASASASSPATDVDVRLPASEERERASLRSLVTRDLQELTLALPGTTPPARISIVVHPTGDAYRRATGRPWWTSAATTFAPKDNGATIHLVPLAGLRGTGRLDATMRHEIVHVLTGPRLRGRPLWVQEGLAAWFSAPAPHAADTAASACPTDADFQHASSPDAFQQAYARAAACVAGELQRGVPWSDVGGFRRNN